MKTYLTLLTIYLIGYQTIDAGDNPGSSEPPGYKLKLKDGRVLHYREYGSRKGKLVLYFHGINSASREPELIEGEIRQSGLRVVSIDRPGIGKSTFSCERGILDWVDDVKQLTSALGCANQPFGIITTSGGSSYGCACAVKIPHRVSHLALVSPFSPLDLADVTPGNVDGLVRFAGNRPNLAKATLKSFSAKLEKNPDKIMKRAAKKYSSADIKLIYDSSKHYQRRIDVLHQVFAQGPCGLQTELALHGGDWGFEVCHIKGVPVSIWSGGDDPISTPSMAQYFHKQISGSRLTTGENDGHSTILKNYSRAILRQF